MDHFPQICLFCKAVDGAVCISSLSHLAIHPCATSVSVFLTLGLAHTVLGCDIVVRRVASSRGRAPQLWVVLSVRVHVCHWFIVYLQMQRRKRRSVWAFPLQR